jgi:hypothetical protein
MRLRSCHHLGCVVERQSACRRCRGDLALAVANDGVGLDAQRAPEGSQGDHHGKEGGLHDVDAVEGSGALVAAEDGEQVPIDVRSKRALARFELCPEDRRGVEQREGHPFPLRALPWKDEDELPIAGASSENGGGGGVALSERIEGREELSAIVGHESGTVLEVGAAFASE